MIDAILDPVNLITGLACIGGFLSIVAFGAPLLESDQFSSRLKAVARRREELQAANQARRGPQKSRLRQQQGRTYVWVVVEKLKLLDPTSSQAVKDALTAAGQRGPGPLYTYAFFRFVAPVVVAIVTAVYFFVLVKTEMSVAMRLMIALGGGIAGFLTPQIILKNMISKRQMALTKSFPDALDLMVICVEAGLSMEAAFQRVAHELEHGSPELAEEFSLTCAELAFLPDRQQALQNLAKRTQLPSIRALVTALGQAEKYGTSVAVALRVIATEQRDERMSRAERKAGALPAQLTVPMIAFFLPVLFIVLLGPAIIRTMQNVQ